MSKKFYQAIALVFGLSWGLALVAKLIGIKYEGSAGLTLAVLYMFMPAISVFILSKFVWKTDVRGWGIQRPINRWFFAGWFWPIILVFATIPVSLLIPGVSFAPGMEGLLAKYATLMPADQIAQMKAQISSFGPLMILIMIGQGMIAGITINAIAAFGEELMWRGFLLKEFKEKGLWKASLIIGSIWGIWHAPLILQGHNYPSHPYIGVLMMVIWCILLTPALIYFTARTRSVITAAVLHGTLNGSAMIAMVWIMGGNDLTVGVTGLAGFITLIVLNVLLFIYDKRSKVKIDQLMKDY